MADAALIPLPFEGTLLERPLEGPPPVATEGDEPDPRVEAVTEAVANGDYAAAARAAEALLRVGGHDARIVGAYLFGAFHERGLPAMAGLFRSLHQVLTASHAALGPVDKRDVFLDSGLRWLLRTLNKHLAHHEKKQDATWRRWCEPDCRPPLEEALALSGPILTGLATVLPKNGCEEPFRNLTLWLSRHVQSLPAPAVAEPATPSEPAATAAASAPAMTPPSAPASAHTTTSVLATTAPAASVHATASVLAHLASGPAAPAPASTPAAPPGSAVPGLPISPALALLLRKLDAFDALLNQGELAKAGVVAADVLGTVERFDPRLYLPALFSRFFSGLSAHAHELEPFLQGSHSLPLRALEQLYRVDLDAFLAQRLGGAGAED